MKLEARLEHAAVPVGAPALMHVLLTVTAPDAAEGHARPELNIAAVVDRSGSMAGAKLAYAKAAVEVLLNNLAPSDRFSLVAFDDVVQPLIEGSRTADRTIERTAVQQIRDGGSTNLSGGWLKGIELVSQTAGPGRLNAVLLLTDGQANHGITDPDQLAALGASVLKDKEVRTTCLGLGEGFAEDLLKDIAVAAGGRFHYIASPDHAPEIFQEELGGLLSTVAQNVELSLDFADGVEGVAQLTGYPWKIAGAAANILLGDFHAGQVKHVLLVAQLPALQDPSDLMVAAMHMTYAAVSDQSVDLMALKQPLVAHVVASDAPAAPDPEVLLHIGIQRAAKARQEAVSELDKGEPDAAAKVLDAEAEQLRGLAPLSSAPGRLSEEAEELGRRAHELRAARDHRDSRKFMVSEGTMLSQSNFHGTRTSRERRSRRDSES